MLSSLNLKQKPRLFVNYIRRADPSTQEILKLISNNNPNFEIKGHCFYTKGALNSASHFLNLLESWLGTSSLTPINSHSACEISDDFNIDFIAKFDNASILFQHGKEEFYSLYHLHIFIIWYSILCIWRRENTFSSP